MSDPPIEGKAADPLEQWRELRDVYMDVWAKAMGEAVNSEAYTQASGAVLDTCLTASSPFRDAQKKTMITALEQLNMPSRAEFVSLAERLSNIELLLDDMSAKLDQIHQVATAAASPAAPETKQETTKRAAQPITQPIAEAKPETKGAAQPASEAKSEAKSETKSAARREAVKSAKKGSR